VPDGADRPACGRRRRPAQRLVAERQQVLDAAAAARDDDDVDLGIRSSSRSASDDLLDREGGPCTATSRDLEVGRRPAPPGVLQHVALGGAGPPVISPTVRGRNGSGRLRSASNSPSAASTPLSRSSRASSSPTPTGRISKACRLRVPRVT
jgi:hypothetical protein